MFIIDKNKKKKYPKNHILDPENLETSATTPLEFKGDLYRG